MYTLILVDYNSISSTISYIGRCRQALRKDEVSHIVIVENGSDEQALRALIDEYGTWERIPVSGISQRVCRFTQEEYQIIYCHSGTNLGYAKGNNLGVAIAQEVWADPYYIISNNDVDFEKPLDLQAAQSLFDGDPRIGVIGPQVKTPAGVQQSPHRWISAYRRLIVFIWLCALDGIVSPQQYKLLRAKYCEDMCYDASTGPCGWVSGSFFIVRAKAFHLAGMFDPNTFLYAEEPILSRRMEVAGYTVWFCRELEVIHKHAQTTKSALSRLRILELDFHAIWYYYKRYTKTSGALLVLAKWNFALYKCAHFLWNKLKSLQKSGKETV